MEGPIVVVDRAGEVNIFASLVDAANWIEPQDARDGEYRVFDFTGAEFLAGAVDDRSDVELRLAGTKPDFDLVRMLAWEVLRSLDSGVPRALPATPTELRDALEPLMQRI